MTNYREIPNKLRKFETFKGNSVNARINSFNFYIVESYATTILEYDLNNNKVTYFSNEYYSTTTSKLQNILIDVFSLNNGIKKRD
jgi:hypothetical protein